MPETAKERKVDILTTSIDLIQKYDYLKNKFKKDYEFLRNTGLKALPLDCADTDGDEVFASVREYITMSADVCRYESHDLYFDIQYVVEGQGRFGHTKRAGLEEEAPYNGADDIVFFKEPEQGGAVLLKAGDYAVVAPEDVHKPRCIAGTPCKVHKIAVKVRV